MLVAYLLLKTPCVCYSVTYGIWAKAMPISGVVSDESKLGFEISFISNKFMDRYVNHF